MSALTIATIPCESPYIAQCTIEDLRDNPIFTKQRYSNSDMGVVRVAALEFDVHGCTIEVTAVVDNIQTNAPTNVINMHDLVSIQQLLKDKNGVGDIEASGGRSLF